MIAKKRKTFFKKKKITAKLKELYVDGANVLHIGMMSVITQTKKFTFVIVDISGSGIAPYNESKI